MYGIPNMKLDKEQVVQRRVDLLAAEGVRFMTDSRSRQGSTRSRSCAKTSTRLCCAAGRPSPTICTSPGRELKGIHFAMEFLRGNTKNLLDTRKPASRPRAQLISAKDKDVIVIGGGDTGTDCVGTSLRHGCRSLAQFEIVPRPPNERTGDNPWPQWPRVYKLDYGQTEAAARFGADPRTYQISTKNFVGDENGHVKELHTVKVEMKFADGRMQFIEIPGTEESGRPSWCCWRWAFAGRKISWSTNSAWRATRAATSKPSMASFKTSIEGIFSAGDMRRGQSLVVWAINEGRGAAREVDRWLMGETSLP